MASLNHSPGYVAYLQSAEWAERRKHKLEQNGYRCQGCGDTERLEVHHLSYRRLGHERPEELMVLCHLCHAHEHGRSPSVGPIAGSSLNEISEAKQAQYSVYDQARRLEQLVTLERKLRLLQRFTQGRQRRRVKTCVHEVRALAREVGQFP